MRASLSRHPAAAQLRPILQGDFTNLCGLYSVLNALQLACWPNALSREQLRDLHQTGVRSLTKRRLLARVIASGMEHDDWLELGSAVTERANELTGGSLAMVPAGRTRRVRNGKSEATLTRIRCMLQRRRPVLCGIGGALNHYTVLSGVSPTRLLFFDSSGFKWIQQRNIGADEHSGKRHWLFGAHLISDDW
jgi:hypothetical protein